MQSVNKIIEDSIDYVKRFPLPYSSPSRRAAFLILAAMGRELNASEEELSRLRNLFVTADLDAVDEGLVRGHERGKRSGFRQGFQEGKASTEYLMRNEPYGYPDGIPNPVVVTMPDGSEVIS